MTGRRGLSPEDRRLWEQVAASLTPLRPEPPRSDAAVPEPAAPARRAAAARRDLPRAIVGPPAQRPADPAHPRMDRRRFEKLRRGRLEPEARLDLHGMSSERAHAALSRFILGAHARDRRLVLVITGKGRPEDAAASRGILRHSLPHWLAAPPLVAVILEVAPAHRRHGGAGAFYVYLRRRR